MTIDALVNLTDGVLQNTPRIHSIEGATVFPSKVELGDLFISSDAEEITQALELGAYAVIYDNEQIVIKDEEVAWIQVTSIQDAAFKLLRYVILQKEAEFFLLSDQENSLLKMIVLQRSNIAEISSEWKRAFEQVLNSPKNLFVGTNEILMQHIKPDIKKLTQSLDGYPILDTLFKSTFRVGKYIYQDKEFIPFYLDALLKVMALCDAHELLYSLDRLKYTKHFIPVFIDGELQKVKSSQSDRVVIFIDNLSDLHKAREYIRHKNTWVKSIVLTPPKVKVDNLTKAYWFENENEVREILKNTHFNYAFVYTLDKSVLKEIKQEYSLF